MEVVRHVDEAFAMLLVYDSLVICIGIDADNYIFDNPIVVNDELYTI